MNLDDIRRINLIEVLIEEAEESGYHCAALPADAAQNWSEEQIRAYFSEQQNCSAGTSQQKVSFAEPDPDEFRKWFPGLPISRTACEQPRWRVLCFPNAGNAEDMYTNEGTGPRRAPSPLLEWCRENGAECLAVQPPGRAMRSREPAITSAKELAAQLLPIVASRLADVPYMVIAHSVGTWVAFELLLAGRAAGLPPPRRAFLSAMAAPDIPGDDRPWRRQRDLAEVAFQDECRSWDVNEVVFSAALWPTYHGLMRADFQLFDEYKFEHEGEPPLHVPLTTFYGSRDRKISAAMVAGWARLTSGTFETNAVEGHHLWPLDKAAKQAWLSEIVARLRLL